MVCVVLAACCSPRARCPAWAPLPAGPVLMCVTPAWAWCVRKGTGCLRTDFGGPSTSREPAGPQTPGGPGTRACLLFFFRRKPDNSKEADESLLPSLIIHRSVCRGEEMPVWGFLSGQSCSLQTAWPRRRRRWALPVPKPSPQGDSFGLCQAPRDLTWLVAPSLGHPCSEGNRPTGSEFPLSALPGPVDRTCHCVSSSEAVGGYTPTVPQLGPASRVGSPILSPLEP